MKQRHQLDKLSLGDLSLNGFAFLGIFFSFIVFFALQIYWQYNEAKLNFVENTHLLEKRFLLEEQSTETLIKALAHYYSSQVVKSDTDFSHFAQSLIPQHPYIDAFGIAKKLKDSDLNAFIQQQHNRGYESFRIQNKQLFQESSTNFTNDYLAVTQVLPMSPQHSVYLGEDLFSLPTLQHEFANQVEQNSMGLYWLRALMTDQQLVLLNHPIYTTPPSSLTAEERAENVIGSVFLFFNISPFIEQAANSEIAFLESIDLRIDHHPLKHYWPIYRDLSHLSTEDRSLIDSLIFNFFDNFHFTNEISISALRDTIRLKIVANWDQNALDVISATLWGAIGGLLFLLLNFVISVFGTYTKRLFKMQSRLEEILHTSHDAVIITNKSGEILSWNPRCEELFGYHYDEMIGQSLIQLFTQLSENNLQDPVEQKLLKLFSKDSPAGKALTFNEKLLELYLLNRDKKRILVEISYSILSVNDTEEISLFIQDITYQRQTESEIKQLAYYDPLTNLENRVLFKQNFESLLNRPNTPDFSVYFIDLDGFKQINDTLGHSIGDELLKVIARRIVNTIQGAHCPHHICRFGGDEFIILIETADDNLTKVLLERLLLKIQRMIRIDGNEMQVSASIGVTFYPEHGKDMDTLLRHADTAMYEAKGLGKNTYSIYQNEMTEQLSRRLLLEKHLRLALEYNEFSLVYQPQMDLESGQIIGVEALIRWNNQSLGFISPDQFIPIAEESRMIIEIGDWVVDTCIKQLIEWQHTQMDGLHIAINVSSVQFNFAGFVDGVYDKMRKAGLPSKLLEIELTERTVMDNADENVERFNDIRNQGFGLSVDDFGTGYSSLSYLKRFPLSILKIDKSFVDGLPTDDDDISIATAILNLAHSLNINVVAEGVETIEQLLFLKEAKCNYAQGYFISRPLPAKDFEAWLEQKTRCFYQSEEFHLALKKITSSEIEGFEAKTALTKTDLSSDA